MAQATKRENGRARKLLTQSQVQDLFAYDPETGSLKWRPGKSPRRRNVKETDEVGCVSKIGKRLYRHVRIDGVLYAVHSVIWLYVYGEWPELLDHRDLDGLNNKIRNLRPADKSKNAANTPPPVNNTSGIKGVHWDAARQKWAAELRHENKRHRIGRFENIEDAAAAYAAKAQELFGEFARTE